MKELAKAHDYDYRNSWNGICRQVANRAIFTADGEF